MLSLLASPFTQFAAACAANENKVRLILSLPHWYKYLNTYTDATGQCSINFTFPDDIGRVGLALVEILLRIAALVAIGFVIYGGFRFILSQGEPDQAAAARSTIVNALIGLVIAVMAIAIVTFAFNSLARY